MIQTRSMTKKTANTPKKVMGKQDYQSLKTETASNKMIQTRSMTKNIANMPKEAVATMRRLLDAQASAINQYECVSRAFPLMEYMLTAGGEYLMMNDEFRITMNKKIQQLLKEGPPIKMAVLLCNIYQKYFL
jgi:hypothetical protein